MNHFDHYNSDNTQSTQAKTWSLSLTWYRKAVCVCVRETSPWVYCKLEEIFRLLSTLTKDTDWWFGTFFIFPYIGNTHPNWLIFFGGVQTTNQDLSSWNQELISGTATRWDWWDQAKGLEDFSKHLLVGSKIPYQHHYLPFRPVIKKNNPDDCWISRGFSSWLIGVLK